MTNGLIFSDNAYLSEMTIDNFYLSLRKKTSIFENIKGGIA